MTFQAAFFQWVTDRHACDNCGKTKVQTTVAGRLKPGRTARMHYTVFICPDRCNSSIVQEAMAS